ncbi:hypothetical protein LJC08_03470 [Methanimicrococcus sp. OttesenSCG-928-J09]|nr:hypothetical protein [Methanimicrococcus sp. OttesenSCG-928-J09]
MERIGRLISFIFIFLFLTDCDFSLFLKVCAARSVRLSAVNGIGKVAAAISFAWAGKCNEKKMKPDIAFIGLKKWQRSRARQLNLIVAADLLLQRRSR